MTEQQAQGAEQQENDGQQGNQAPPWGSDDQFDPEKAWKLIQDLRADKDKLSKRPVLDDAAKAKLSEYEQLKAASQTELEKAQSEVTRWQTEAERWRGTSVSSTIKAIAASDFEFPDDAVTALDPAKYLDVDGTIDEKAIKTDLDKLLDARPNWRKASDGQPRVPAPNRSQGSGGGRAAANPRDEFAAYLSGALNK